MVVLYNFNTIPQAFTMERRRRRNRQIILSERRLLVEMWLRGLSCNAIARQTRISAPTVCRWINRWKQEGNINRRPRCGKALTAALVKCHLPSDISPRTEVLGPLRWRNYFHHVPAPIHLLPFRHQYSYDAYVQLLSVISTYQGISRQ